MKKTMWAVIPHDFEFLVQYLETKQQADALAEAFECGADVSQVEIDLEIINKKTKRIAARGYRL